MTIHAKDVMAHRLIKIPLGTPLEEAQEIMNERRIRHLPVVNEFGQVVGILSQRDFSFVQDLAQFRAEHFMASPVVAIDQEAPLRAGILRMLETKISCLIVTDQSNQAVGIVTTDDLLWRLAEMLKDETSEESRSIIGSFHIETIGQVAHQLAQAGF